MVRSLHAATNYYIFISGSSSKLSSKEISTKLRGRYISRLILPLSFKQFLKFKGFEVKYVEAPEIRGKLIGLLKEYLTFGGFPEIVKKEDKEGKVELLKTYRETIFYRDVIERFKVRDIFSLETFLRILMENFGKYISISKIEKYFKALGVKKSKKTLANYLKYLETAFFIFLVEKLSFKTKDRVLQPKKVYPIDLGFCKLVPKLSEEIGILMECLVARELFKQRFCDLDFEFFYWKDYKGREVDFVLRKGTKFEQLIQVTYASDISEVKIERLSALIEASKDLGCRNLLVITWDYENEKKIENETIIFMPLWKWLLRVL